MDTTSRCGEKIGRNQTFIWDLDIRDPNDCWGVDCIEAVLETNWRNEDEEGEEWEGGHWEEE